MKKLSLLLFLFVGLVTVSIAQRTVSGKVTDQSGLALIGANVLVPNTSAGTITDVDGNFSISVPEGSNSLEISYTGFENQIIDITGQSYVDVQLAEGQLLDEVVVIGYGSNSERFNTQSVAAIGSDQIKNRPVFSPQELLQGQAAGVQMVTSSGLLGANSSVRIRGAASITGGGEPLYVVDGVPLNDRNMGFNQGGGTGLNPLMNINSNDIESMTVLKDAAAVSIYGSRGANGVVLITTKKGSKGQKTNITVDAVTGVSDPTEVFPVMNAAEFTSFVNQRRVATNRAERQFPEGGFDWVDAVVRQGTFNNINIGASGGGDKTTFYLGGSVRNESGFTIGNDARTLAGRLNLGHQVNDRLNVGANISISNVDMDRIGAENNTYAPLTSSYLQLPFVQPRDEAGAFVNTGFIQNVLGIEELNDNTYVTDRITSNVFAELSLIQKDNQSLTLKSDWGIDRFGAQSKYRSIDLFDPTGLGYLLDRNDNKWLTTNTLNYNLNVGDNSTFGLLGGYSFETSRFTELYLEGTGFASDEFRNLSSAANPTAASEEASEWALESQFLRANYNHNGKYIVEGTLRRDGSSRFGADNRYGIFWAGSAGWIVSEESFMKNQGFFDFLKLTASYGTAGNDRIGDFSSLALYGGGALADYDGAPGIRPTQIPFPALTWEETTQLDLGLSTRFLDNKISLDFNWYNKTTDGLLLNVPFPFTTGFASASQNVGSMRNRGIDINIDATVMRRKNFSWSVGLNAGYLQNEVLSLPEDNVDPDGNVFLDGSASQRAVVGRTLNEFYLVRANGVNPSTGDFEWLDKEGNPTTTYSAANRVFVGSAIPKYVGGFNTNFEFFNFDLGLLFNFSQGNKVMIDGLRFTDNIGTESFNKSTDLLDYWTQEGDQAFAPALGSPTAALFNQRSTLQLQNGSFLRLRNLTLGYTIPSTLVSKQNILQGARVFLTGQNLWLLKASDFRGPDPEVSANGANNLVQGESFFALPQARIITFGLSVNL